MTRSHSAASIRCTGPPPATPAAFTTPSMRPWSATIAADQRRRPRRRRVTSSTCQRSPSAPACDDRRRPRCAPSASSRSHVAEPDARRRARDEHDLARQLPFVSTHPAYSLYTCAMRFALFYEIPVARPWAPDSEHRAYKNTLEQAIAGEQCRLPRVLDRRAPLPRGVLALLEPRGAVRRDRGADRAHAPRLRRAAHAEAVQPPGAHRGVGRGARPAHRRPRRLRHRPLGDAHRARGLRHRPAARRARCGRRRSSTSSAAGRTTSTRSRASTGRCPTAACSRSRCSSRTRRSGARRTSDDGHRAGRRARPRPVLVRGRRAARGGEEEDRHLPRRRSRRARSRSASSSTTRPRRSRWRCARRRASEALGDRARVVRVVPEGRARARSRRSRSGWPSASRSSATTTTRPTCEGASDDGSLDLLTPRVPRRLRRVRARHARPVPRGVQALRGGRASTCCCAS